MINSIFTILAIVGDGMQRKRFPSNFVVQSKEEQRCERRLQMAHRVGRKTRKRERRLERAVQNVRKHEMRAARISHGVDNGTLYLLYDPQGMFLTSSHCYSYSSLFI